MAAGLTLAPRFPDIDKAAMQRKTEKVQATLLAKVADRPIADELRAVADILRRWRNYGVHPGDNVDPFTEAAAFDEAACGLPFLEAHRHLTLLASTVTKLTTTPP